MFVIGKLIFGYLGYRFGGPPYLFAGLLFGHAIDAGISLQWQKRRQRQFYDSLRRAQQNEAFFRNFFCLLGKFAACDGPPSDAEIKAAQAIAKQFMQLNRKQEKLARSLFADGALSSHSVQDYTAQLFDIFQQQPKAIENIFRSLLHIAVSDGHLSQPEIAALSTAAKICNMDRETFQAILQSCGIRLAQQRSHARGPAQDMPPSSDTAIDPYSLLGCDKADSNDEIKRKYRKLVSTYHPDKIVSKDLPEDFVRFAQSRFREIQQAYEELKRERNFA